MKIIKNGLRTKKKLHIKNNVILTCKSVWYYSEIDEDLFFAWIKRIPSIIKFKGIGDELHLYIKSNTISNDDLGELIGLFYRYKINMEQLKQFVTDDNKEWFTTEGSYWFEPIFGSDKLRKN